MSFQERLRKMAIGVQTRDPWEVPIASLQGQIGRDGVERLSTIATFDAIGIPRHERTPAAAKRLKALMESRGWTAIRQPSLTPMGSVARMRGYARVIT